MSAARHEDQRHDVEQDDTRQDAAASILLAATPAAWVDAAVAGWQELLVDHANCEKKAASTAVALIEAEIPSNRGRR